MKAVSLITGSSRGIGRGIALELAAAGTHDIVINYAGNETAARECQQLCLDAAKGQIRVEIVQGDISKAADRAALIDFVRSYLDAQQAIAQGFADIKSHQVLTYAAMQAAMRRLAAELDPAEIEKTLPAPGGLGDLLGSHKSRLWDFYSTRWQAKTEHLDDGLVDVFMLYFGDCYAKATEGG